MLLHFGGLSPFIRTATNTHVLSAVITHPVRGHVFSLAAYSGATKLNYIERVLAFPIDQIAHIQVTLLVTSREVNIQHFFVICVCNCREMDLKRIRAG